MKNKPIKTITRALLESWHPCKEYTKERIDKLANGRKSIAVKTVFDLPIPAVDRVWLLCHEGVLPDEVFCRLARAFAYNVIDLWNAPSVVKDYLRTGDKSLRTEANRAAMAAWAAEAARAAGAAEAADAAGAAWAAWTAGAAWAARAARAAEAAEAAWAARAAEAAEAAWAAEAASAAEAEWQLEQIRDELFPLTEGRQQ